MIEEEKKIRLIEEFDKLLVEIDRPLCIKKDCPNHKVETRDRKTIIRRGYYTNKTLEEEKLPKFQCKLCNSILRFEEKSITEIKHKYRDVPLKIFTELSSYITQYQLAKKYKTSVKSMVLILDGLTEITNDIWLPSRFSKIPSRYFVIEDEIGLQTKHPQAVFFSFDVVSGNIDGVEVLPIDKDKKEKIGKLETLLFKFLNEAPIEPVKDGSLEDDEKEKDELFNKLFDEIPVKNEIRAKPTYEIMGPHSYEGFLPARGTEGTAIDLRLFDDLHFQKWQSYKSNHEARQKMVLFAIAHNNHLRRLKKSKAA